MLGKNPWERNGKMGKRDREIPDSCNEVKVPGVSMKITIPEILPSLNKYAGTDERQRRNDKMRLIDARVKRIGNAKMESDGE